MEAAAHTRGGYDGVPQSVGEEFAQADKAKRKKPAKTTRKTKKRGRNS